MKPRALPILCAFLLFPFSAMSTDQFAQPVETGNRFENPASFTNWTGVPSIGQTLYKTLFEKGDRGVPDNEKELSAVLPVLPFTGFEDDDSLSTAWLGHATVIVRMDGATFLTDPVWSESRRMHSRYRPPPCDIRNSPKIDFAVISHDHLDIEAVREISSRFPDMTWFVPLGFADLFEREGVVANIREMNWGDSSPLVIRDRLFTVHSVPAQHWGQRKTFDRNKRLWSGFVVKSPNHNFYYAGDTGECSEEFEKIGRLLGPFDLAAIPIGCYEPHWLQSSQHIGPEEAIRVHKAVRSRFSIGVHWGTFRMGGENYLAPRDTLLSLATKVGLEKEFVTLQHGQVWRKE